jgi:lipoprotein-anchoring transpeptidase ErfK/SrfK
MTNAVRHTAKLCALVGAAALFSTASTASPFNSPFWQPQAPSQAYSYAPEPEVIEQAPAYELPAHLRRQIVNYDTREAPGTIIVDTANTYLYLVIGNGKAMRYGIGVGRDGFTWSGTQRVARKAEWPDWRPPSEMIERQPYLPRFVAGGEHNPLGARALYLGSSIYRIHGTNAPHTIGKRVSSGCIRMTNDDVTDLYARVNVGTRVVVLPAGNVRANENRTPAHARPVRLQGPHPLRPSDLY